MAQRKFDETERKAVIRSVERELSVRLTRVGRRRKWFRDEFGRSYWIVGGYGEWHGIPEEMMEAEAANPTDGFLVVAIRRYTSLQTYIGQLEPIVDGRLALYRAAQTTGDYQFTYKKRGSGLALNQLPSVHLAELSAFGYTAEDKESDKRANKANEALRILDKMSDEEKRQFLADLEHGN